MHRQLVLHTIAVVLFGLGLLGANCEGSGLKEDCKPGELGCACGNFPECPKDEKNRPTLCCPDPLLYCAEGNICKSIGSSGGPTGGDGDGSDTDAGGTTTAGTGSDATGSATTATGSQTATASTGS